MSRRKKKGCSYGCCLLSEDLVIVSSGPLTAFLSLSRCWPFLAAALHDARSGIMTQVFISEAQVRLQPVSTM